MNGRSTGWLALRGLLAFSGFSLLLYVAYRYLIGGPPDAGHVYGVIFPGSVLLGGTAIVLAVKPFTLLEVRSAGALRAGLVALSLVWMGTGLLYLRSLAAGALAAPLAGTLDLLHMLTHHVVVPAGVALLAAFPGWVRTQAEEPAGGRKRMEPSAEAEPEDEPPFPLRSRRVRRD